MNSLAFKLSQNFGSKTDLTSRGKNRKKVLQKFKKRKPEIIAWALFFGVGVAYFIATLIIALV